MNLPKFAPLRHGLVEHLRHSRQAAVQNVTQAAAKVAEAAGHVQPRRAVAVGLATAAAAATLMPGADAPQAADFHSFTAPFSNCAPAPATATHPEALTGTLPDGTSFRVALDKVAAGRGSPQSADLACSVEQSAAAQGEAELRWLQSPEGKAAPEATRAAAESVVRGNRVTAAAADLELVTQAADLNRQRQQLSGEMRLVHEGERHENWGQVASQYASLAAQQQAASQFSPESAQHRAQQDLRLLRFGSQTPASEHAFVQGGPDAADQAGARVSGALDTNTPDALKAFRAASTDALRETQLALVRQATPLWASDHPMEAPPAATLAALDAGLRAHQDLKAIGAPLEAAYRATPGVGEKHMGDIERDFIAPVFARELPGGKPSPEMTAKAVAMWKANASPADVAGALTPMIHATPEWRKSVVAPHLGDYYNQKLNWDCGPSSAANIFDFLGIAPADDALAAKFISAFNATPDIGVPGGVDYMAPRMMDIARQDYGVNLTGYLGNGRDFNAIRDALNQGYVLILNGTVVGSANSGHFIAIKALNPDGTLQMADPWLPEFANRTITFDQLAQFTNNPSHTPQFFAFARS